MINDEYVAKFRQIVKDEAKTENVYLFGSSTMAHEILFYSFSKRQTIIFQANCFPSVAFAADRADLNIQFVDIDPKTLDISLESLKFLNSNYGDYILHITSSGGRIPSNIEQIKNIIAGNGKIVHDAAHSFGARREQHGTADWADYTVYSFSSTKPVTCGQGAALVSKETLPDNLENFGRYGKGYEGYGFDYAGWSSKFEEMQGALGVASYQDYQSTRAIRNNIAQQYQRGVSNRLELYDYGESSYYKFPVFIPDDEDYKKVVAALEKAEIGLSSKIYSKHALESCREAGLRIANDAVVEGAARFASNHLCLPMNIWLRKADVSRIIDTVNDALK